VGERRAISTLVDGARDVDRVVWGHDGADDCYQNDEAEHGQTDQGHSVAHEALDGELPLIQGLEGDLDIDGQLRAVDQGWCGRTCGNRQAIRGFGFEHLLRASVVPDSRVGDCV
jgi:hypothetical protein